MQNVLTGKIIANDRKNMSRKSLLIFMAEKMKEQNTSIVIKKTLEAGFIKVSDPEHPRGGYEPIWA